MPSNQGSQPSIDPGLTGMVKQAVADLATRLDVVQGAISVISAELVTWPDSSYGCPQKGRVYLQVVADGSRIVLAHGNTRFEYHTGGSTIAPFLCTTPTR